MAAEASAIDWIALGGTAVNLAALFFQHRWVRSEIRNNKDLARRATLIERPIERAQVALIELERANKDLKLGRSSASCDEVMSRATACSREIARAVNLAAEYSKPKLPDFDSLDTDDLLELAHNLSDDRKILVTGQIEAEARRLGDRVDALLASYM